MFWVFPLRRHPDANFPNDNTEEAESQINQNNPTQIPTSEMNQVLDLTVAEPQSSPLQWVGPGKNRLQFIAEADSANQCLESDGSDGGRTSSGEAKTSFHE